MKKYIYLQVFLFLGGIMWNQAYAQSPEKPWKFDLSGKIHAESRLFASLDLVTANDPINNSNTKTASQLGGLFDLSFAFKNLSLMSSFNVSTDPFTNTKTYFSNGLAGGQKTDSSTYGPTVTASGTNHPNAYFGSTSTGPWSFTVGSDGDANFMIRTLHMKWTTAWANYYFGRMPRHWGLGMFLNSGKGLYDRFQNVTDSIFVEKELDFLWNSVLTAGYSHLGHGINLDQTTDDTRVYEFQWTKSYKNGASGFLYATQRRHDQGFQVHYVDAFFTKTMSEYTVGLEALYNFGDVGINDVLASRFGVALENKYRWSDTWTLFLNGGVASGSKSSDSGRLMTFAFNRNYNPLHTLILFDQGVGRLATTTIGTGARSDADLDVNTIFNALYVGGGAHWKGIKKFDLEFSAGSGWAHEKFPNTSSFYGVELDVAGTWELDQDFMLRPSAGIFIPGDLYEGGTNKFQTDPASAVGLQLTYLI